MLDSSKSYAHQFLEGSPPPSCTHAWGAGRAWIGSHSTLNGVKGATVHVVAQVVLDVSSQFFWFCAVLCVHIYFPLPTNFTHGDQVRAVQC